MSLESVESSFLLDPAFLNHKLIISNSVDSRKTVKQFLLESQTAFKDYRYDKIEFKNLEGDPDFIIIAYPKDAAMTEFEEPEDENFMYELITGREGIYQAIREITQGSNLVGVSQDEINEIAGRLKLSSKEVIETIENTFGMSKQSDGKWNGFNVENRRDWAMQNTGITEEAFNVIDQKITQRIKKLGLRREFINLSVEEILEKSTSDAVFIGDIFELDLPPGTKIASIDVKRAIYGHVLGAVKKLINLTMKEDIFSSGETEFNYEGDDVLIFETNPRDPICTIYKEDNIYRLNGVTDILQGVPISLKGVSIVRWGKHFIVSTESTTPIHVSYTIKSSNAMTAIDTNLVKELEKKPLEQVIAELGLKAKGVQGTDAVDLLQRRMGQFAYFREGVLKGLHLLCLKFLLNKLFIL